MEPGSTSGEWSGRRALLLLLVGVPLLVVPLLLTGRASETEICLVTLERRTDSWWAIGSLALSQPDWKPVSGWPGPQLHPSLLEKFDGLPASGPADWRRAMGLAGEGHVFMDVERTMPFAFAMGIPNSRALDPRRARIVEVRLLAAAVLDPGSEADRECYGRLDALLSDSLADALRLRGRKRRNAPPAAGEIAAERILRECLDALDSENPATAVREVLCRDAAPSPSVDTSSAATSR